MIGIDTTIVTPGTNQRTAGRWESYTLRLCLSWMSSREFERAVFAALILAGEPVNNHRLAELMDCSPDEASRRVAQLEGLIRKARNGREVLLRTLTTMLKLPMGTAAARVALPVL